jgi:hypothetical protein
MFIPFFLAGCCKYPFTSIVSFVFTGKVYIPITGEIYPTVPLSVKERNTHGEYFEKRTSLLLFVKETVT